MKYIYKWCGHTYEVKAETEYSAYIYLIEYIVSEMGQIELMDQIDENKVEELGDSQ